MPARLVVDTREALGPGEFVDLRVWLVEPSEYFPDGSKFSFAHVREAGGREVVEYRMDNAHGAGAHEHLPGHVDAIPDAPWRLQRALFRRRVGLLRRGEL